jgi:hypothetical protein
MTQSLIKMLKKGNRLRLITDKKVRLDAPHLAVAQLQQKALL